MKLLTSTLLMAGLLAAALSPAPALADRPRDHMVFDQRYHHDHYYPAPGWVAPGLPRGAVVVRGGPSPFYFHGGVWYRPDGPRFRVVLPPLGLIVPVLPWAYVTLSIGGLPYFYANGVYYRHAVGGYEVVTAPPEADRAQPVQNVPPARPDPIIYPRNGQSPQQQEADRQECNRWATTQPAAMNEASVFNRAVEACMDGRGYTMK
ncbi:DUF6515 family protein [Pelomonas sp. SE-A7]|uniref:DUF6515 family protein n=1 Tax=Pelomonas sp. SE-A7 TaxID=3054953 RepID=UPI00259C9AD5|nr:DUF6515 family protein [Pelomonas sp. SE-A7]MDM4768190.1 hypothetical protein [Pelomonas sp. SE-A7]